MDVGLHDSFRASQFGHKLATQYISVQDGSIHETKGSFAHSVKYPIFDFVVCIYIYNMYASMM